MNSFKIPEQNVLLSGTVSCGFETDIPYIVYYTEKSVNVNTDFTKDRKGIYHCCPFYDRALCLTTAEFAKLTVKEIESQARFSFADGAR